MKYRISFPYFMILCVAFLALGAADSCSRSPQRAESKPEQKTGTHEVKTPAGRPGLREVDPEKKFRKEETDRTQRFWKDPEIADALELSAEQIAAFDTEVEGFLRDLGGIRHTQRVSYQKMLMSLQQGPVQEDLFKISSRNFGEAERRRIELMTTQLREFREILTKEQWTRLRKIRPRALQIDRFRPVAMGVARAVISEGSGTSTPPTPESN